MHLKLEKNETNMKNFDGLIEEILKKTKKIYSFIVDYELKELKEIEETMYAVRTVLSNFANVLLEEDFEFFARHMYLNLHRTMEILSKNINVRFAEYVWEDKLEILDNDYFLKQQIDQMEMLYGQKKLENSVLMLEDDKAIKFWQKNFGVQNRVDLKTFIKVLTEEYCDLTFDNDSLDVLESYLDFTNDYTVSLFDFKKFLGLFSPFEKSLEKIFEMCKFDIRVHHISTSKARVLLECKPCYHYILRFSKNKTNCFALSFIDKNGKINHTLVDRVDEGMKLKGSKVPFPSFPAFLEYFKRTFKHPLTITQRNNAPKECNYTYIEIDLREEDDSQLHQKKREEEKQKIDCNIFI